MFMKDIYDDINKILKKNENKEVNRLIRKRLRQEVKVEEEKIKLHMEMARKRMEEFDKQLEISRNEGY